MHYHDNQPHLSFDAVFEFLTADGKPYKLRGGGGMFCCPCHEDRSPSLSVRETAEGGVLVHCFACPPGTVFEYLRDRLRGFEVELPARVPTPPKPKKVSKVHETLERACAALEWHNLSWSRIKTWVYRDATGAVRGAVVRWRDADGKKQIRPFRRDDDGWRAGAMTAPRPLLNLPKLILSNPSETVFVLEGEKAADAAASLGWLATTCAGGSSAPHLTDWTPLAGRNVVVLPDNDDAGRMHAAEVTRLAYGVGAASVRILDLVEKFPGLPHKGDLADLVASGEVVA